MKDKKNSHRLIITQPILTVKNVQSTYIHVRIKNIRFKYKI